MRGVIATWRQAVMRRVATVVAIAVADAPMDRVVIAVMRTRMVAVIRGTCVTAAAIPVGVMTIAIPTGYRAFLIRRIRCEIAGTGIGRALIDVIILLHRIGQP